MTADADRVRAQVFRGDDGDWYVRVLGDNGEPVFASEGHRNRTDAVEIARDYTAPGTPIDIDED